MKINAEVNNESKDKDQQVDQNSSKDSQTIRTADAINVKAKKSYINKKASNSKKGGHKQTRLNAKARVTLDKTNDPSWYALNPELVESGSKVVFTQRLGSAIIKNIRVNQSGKLNNLENVFAELIEPGIMTLKYQYTAGESDGPVSTLSMAGKIMFANIRKSVSGSRPYEATDLTNYLLAVGSLYAAMAEIRRAYAACNTVNIQNTYTRADLVKTLEFDYGDLTSNLADINYWINTMQTKINLLPIPKGLPFIDRWFMLNSSLFLDEQSSKAQMYAFVNHKIYKYTFTTHPEVGHGPVSLINTRFGDKFADFKRDIESSLDMLLTDHDLAIIAGDILRTYGDTGIARLLPLEANSVVVPTYSESMLQQIHNATIVPVAVKAIHTIANKDVNSSSYLDYEWETNIIDNNSADATWANEQYLLNPHTDSVILDTTISNPTPMDTLEMSRLAVTYDMTVRPAQVDQSDYPNGASEVVVKPIAFGTEIISKIRIFYYLNQDNSRPELHDVVYSARIVIVGKETKSLGSRPVLLGQYALGYILASKFTMAPLGYYFYKHVRYSIGTYGMVDNYANVDTNVLKNLHEIAVLSEFGVTNYGKGVFEAKR